MVRNLCPRVGTTLFNYSAFNQKCRDLSWLSFNSKALPLELVISVGLRRCVLDTASRAKASVFLLPQRTTTSGGQMSQSSISPSVSVRDKLPPTVHEETPQEPIIKKTWWSWELTSSEWDILILSTCLKVLLFPA